MNWLRFFVTFSFVISCLALFVQSVGFAVFALGLSSLVVGIAWRSSRC
jgi:small-conductance mechanosensitive channel